MTDNVRLWNMDTDNLISVGDFNNISDMSEATFPGIFSDTSAVTERNEGGYSEKMPCDSDYKYFFRGFGYAYGILKDGREELSILTDSGSIIPVFSGAGYFCLKTSDGVEIIRNIKIKSFTETEEDGILSLKVCYSADGDFEYLKELSNTYVFGDCLSVKAHINCMGLDSKALASESRFKGIFNTKCNYRRLRISKPDRSRKRVAYFWDYPSDNDFVHKETDAVVFSDEFGKYALYTYVRDENSTGKVKINRISSVSMPLEIDGKSEVIDYTYDMTLVFLENDRKATYHSYFKGKGLEFAAGVEAVFDNLGSTFFVGRDLHLNLNVTNLVDTEKLFSARYNIIDYDGECVDSGIFYNNRLKPFGEANRNIKLTLDKYGMYFLNLYVKCGDGEHRECYPFAMVEEYEFKYRPTNPFGLTAPHTDQNELVNLPIATLAGKLGITSMRIDRQYDNFELSDLFFENGVTRQLMGIPVNNDPETVEDFKETVRSVVSKWKDRAAVILLANEADKYCKANYDKSVKYIKNTFLPCNFEPSYEIISKEFSDKLDSVVWESNCHGSTEWFEAFYEAGLWDKSEIIDIHSYSSPTGPDKCFSNQMSSMFASLFSNEYAAVRWKRICRRYGKKRLMIGETGYPSNVHDKREIDNRTVADFNVRIALFFLEAGAEMINYYCMFDRTSFLVGTGSWNENYFGACYHADLYGRFMPKPWSAALCNLTRRFDGVERVSFFSKYEEDEEGTLRAFRVEKKDGEEFAVVWSNIYIQPNTNAYGRVNNHERIPMPAWESRWLVSEKRTFDTDADTVRVMDIMGNVSEIPAQNGKVTIEITGSPVYIYGIK